MELLAGDSSMRRILRRDSKGGRGLTRDCQRDGGSHLGGKVPEVVGLVTYLSCRAGREDGKVQTGHS